MTELFILGRIIYLWKSSLETAKKNFYINSFRFLMAADFWVFLTLGLAIVMSVPALNLYMHGTHTVVAHTMGATIGINTMLLLAFASENIGIRKKDEKVVTKGYWVAKDRKSTRLNSSHVKSSYAVFCLKKKNSDA